MKKAISIILILFAWMFVKGQNRPEAYFGMLPDLPGSVCSETDTAGKAQFFRQINNVEELLTQERARRSKEMELKVTAGEPQMESNALKKTGISPELTQQMMALQQEKKNTKNPKQREAIDKKMKALTDQMMQESMNISMGEVQNLKTMDSTGRKAWATAYATEKKAEVMAEPEKYQEQNAKNMQKYQLVKRQKQLNDSLGAQQTRYYIKFRELEEDESGLNLLAAIERKSKELNDLYAEAAKLEKTPDEQKIIALMAEIKSDKESYCALLGPKYVEILSQYKVFTQSSFDAYYRLEDLTNKVNNAQTGVDMSTEPGEFGLGQVGAYLSKLKDAYRYKLVSAADTYVGGGD
jgi:hypothetical protein